MKSYRLTKDKEDEMKLRTEVHRRKDGSVTIKPVMTAGKKKPRRKRRDNHRMRRALIRARES